MFTRARRYFPADESEMLKTKNFGRKSLNEIREILHEMGLGFGMRLESFPNREELERRSKVSQQRFEQAFHGNAAANVAACLSRAME